MQNLSEYLKLNAFDFFKGLFVAMIGAGLVIVQTTIQSGSLSFEWGTIWQVSLTAGISYLINRFFSNANGTLGKK